MERVHFGAGITAAKPIHIYDCIRRMHLAQNLGHLPCDSGLTYPNGTRQDHHKYSCALIDHASSITNQPHLTSCTRIAPYRMWACSLEGKRLACNEKIESSSLSWSTINR